MRHQAKAPSAGSTQATGSSRSLFRRAFATRGASSGSKGSGAPSRRLRATLAVLALAIAAFAITAAPALAAPLAAKTPEVSNVAYTSAHVKGKISSPAEGFFGFTSYVFSYSTDQTNWIPGPEGSFGNPLSGAVAPFEDKEVEGDIGSLETGTKYYVRLTVSNNGNEAVSPGPNPDFTTLIPDPPTIPGEVEATQVLSTSATAGSKVVRPVASDDVTCRFEYVDHTEFEANGFANATVRDCAQNPFGQADAGTEKAVSAPLGCTAPLTDSPESCLKPETTYHLRLSADNAASGVVTKDAVSTFTTAAKVPAPSVIKADDATEVSYFSAKVSGEVQRPAGDDPALNTACRFEYVTDEQFQIDEFSSAEPNGQIAECAEAPSYAPLTGTDPTVVNADLSGLKAGPTGTTYHLRLIALNGGGTDSKEAASTFTTTPSQEPTLTVNPVAPADVGYAKVHVIGNVYKGEPQHSMSFGWQISTEPGVPESWAQAPNDVNICCEAEGDTERNLGGLKPGTTYYVRIFGNDYGEGVDRYTPEPYESFTTKGTSAPPIVSLDSVSGITATTAHFSGSVDPNGPDEALDEEGKATYRTKWRIVCTPECKDVNGNEIGGTVDGDQGPTPISVDTKRLDPNTHYQDVKLIAENVLAPVSAPVETPVQEFDTLKIAPTVKAAPGGSDGNGGYVLQGTVNPNGSEITGCKFAWGPESHPDPDEYAFEAVCSPDHPGAGAKAVTVEAPLTSLNPNVDYHFRLFATNELGTAFTEDATFKAIPAEPEDCPNTQIRKENSSLALPECRAYELVTPNGKEGFDAGFTDFDGGERVSYRSKAGNIAKSGQNYVFESRYVASRSETGWETIPNLNGSSGSVYDAPTFAQSVQAPAVRYSADLRSSLWVMSRKGDVGNNFYLRHTDGTFSRIDNITGQSPAYLPSADLSHLFLFGNEEQISLHGPGIYEFVGAHDPTLPRRVDVDNSGDPITTCGFPVRAYSNSYPKIKWSAGAEFSSSDGRVVVFNVAGRDGACAPSAELWARIDGTTSINVSASQCDRSVGDLGGACNASLGTLFRGAAKDGSRVFFTTKRQLLNADIDEGNDLYACDIPTPAPAPVGKANPCDALRQVSGGDPAGAGVESVNAVSEDGSAAYFVAKGVLADNEDAFGDEAVAGDHNLYAWRIDAAHPDGQTTFVARLDSSQISGQATPDGRYLVFTTASRLLDTDTDNAVDVYRYDLEAEKLTRASTNVFGVAGNGEGFDVEVRTSGLGGFIFHNSHPAVSDDGQKVVFVTAEPLAPADGNGEPDVYLWTPGGVSLISSGSSGSAPKIGGKAGNPRVAIDPSGRDIYFEAAGALTPADGDDLTDVYDARIGGGFSFAEPARCSGADGACQSHSPGPASSPAPVTGQPPADPGNVKPKPCPKGKVRNKKGKCVKKPNKKHSKKHHGKKAGHKQGGGK